MKNKAQEAHHPDEQPRKQESAPDEVAELESRLDAAQKKASDLRRALENGQKTREVVVDSAYALVELGQENLSISNAILKYVEANAAGLTTEDATQG